MNVTADVLISRGGGSWTIFQDVYIGGAYVKLRFWMGIDTLGRGWFFFYQIVSMYYKHLQQTKWKWKYNIKYKHTNTTQPYAH